MAAYSNPEFYTKLGQGFPTYDIPRIVYCGYDDGDYIVLPRGLQASLADALADAAIQFDLTDRRQPGKKVDMHFTGELYPEQMDAAGHQEELIGLLRSAGTVVRCSERCREHFAVIDNDIVWYGSMNLLSREKEEDSMMRLENASIPDFITFSSLL